MVRWFCFKSRNKVVPDDGIYTIGMSSATLDVNPPDPEQSPEMQSRRHGMLWHVLIDLPVLLIVSAVTILFEVGVLPSHKAGFFCNDPALSYPYNGDTVSISTLAVITIFMPLVVLWVVEAIQHRQEEYTKQNRLLISLKAAGLIYKDYFYGLALSVIIAEVMKCVVGWPRPTFFELCEPDRGKACNGTEFISQYTCTSRKYSRYLQVDSSRSFPSVHALGSTYSGLFVAWYLQRRAFNWRNRSILIVPLCQTISLVFAVYCSMSRVTDRRHHWSDVLFGSCAGALAAVYTVLVLCKNFSRPSVESSSDISSTDNNHQSVRRLLSSEPHVIVP